MPEYHSYKKYTDIDIEKGIFREGVSYLKRYSEQYRERCAKGLNVPGNKHPSLHR